jgi:dipeptidyl aminopeptidase/acylaminoacyl peptidase
MNNLKLLLIPILLCGSLLIESASSTLSEETKNNAELFSTLPDVTSVKLSPNGKFVGVAQKAGSKRIVKIIDLENSKIIHVHEFGKKGKIASFSWITDERLAFTVIRNSTRVVSDFFVGQMVASNIDGKKTKLIAGSGTEEGKGRFRDKKGSSRPAQIVSTLRGDDDHILVNFFDNAGFNELSKLNINTGKVTLVATSPLKYPNWILDADNNLLAVTSSDRNLEQEIFIYKPSLKKDFFADRTCKNEKNCYLPKIVEDNKKPEWVFFKDFIFPFSGILADFDGDEKLILEEYRDKDTSGLYEYNLRTKEVEQIFRDERVDIAGYMGAEGRLYGLMLMDGYPEYLLLDTNNPVKDIALKAYKAFPKQFVSIISYSDDFNKAIISVSGDRNPGTFYLLDQKQNQIVIIGKYWSKTSYAGLAKMEVIDFKTRDGTNVQTHFTKSLKGENSPTVIYPHGGPWARDDWGFDPEVQFLAAEGFNVVQMNIRGSSGYGMAHMKHVYKNFDGALTDMFEGIEYYHDEGLIDKDKVCIYGISYGGYASTQGPMMRPDLFKCAVSEAGLYDIEAQYTSGDIRKTYGGISQLETSFGKGPEAREQSPVEYVEKLQTPFLLIHGEKDQRTPYKEAVAFMKAMDKAGIEYEKLIIEKEEHGFRDPVNRKRKLEVLVSFLNKHLN